MAKNKTTLIIRLSALGDVAMTIPVVYSVARRYPADKFVLLTKTPFQCIFINKPDNLEVVGVDTKKNNILSVVRGLRVKPTMVADLHSVLRSWMVDIYFRVRGKKAAVINKGKRDKQTLTRSRKKQMRQLPTSIERYQRVFEKLGYDAAVDFKSLLPDKTAKDETWMGIAPFAKHQGKIYPLELMENVVNRLNSQQNIRIFLFGSKAEAPILNKWAEKYNNVQSVAGRLSFEEELRLMNDLNVMLSMDSANMHLASLVNTPVVSVWGATHPYAGFYGYNQPIVNAIEVDLECRPCSVFGNKPCKRGDYACMQQIQPERIVEKMNNEICVN
ncbi:glycosyl transferase family 1 [Bacteroidia bacterium]|nr:glycosyl transferase family 1 [Bacteroidia bacterium]